jgi:lysophospholipase L1-like esterase
MSDQKDLNDIKTKITFATPLTWVFVGDSITHGVVHTFGWRAYPELFSEHLRYELNRSLDVVINTAISGNEIKDILNHLDWRVLRFKPDIVFLMIGTNDSTLGHDGINIFRSNILIFIENMRRIGAIPVINTPNPVITEFFPNCKDLPLYIDVLREIAASNNVVLIDHYQHWQATKCDFNSMMMWLSDSLHPNEYGHREFAKLIFKTLDIFDKSPTCSFWVP